MKTKARLPFPPEMLQELARQLADYRLNGCRDGAAAAVMAETKRAAAKHGRSYSELWAMVHAEAYKIIDADPRAAIG